MRGWIPVFVWLLINVPSALAAFIVEFHGDRGAVQVHSVLSVNAQGVILRPMGGGFGNGVRHQWSEFTARSLQLLQDELQKDPLFNQKSAADKYKIIEAIGAERLRQGPAVAAPLVRPVPVTNAPAPPQLNPTNGIPATAPAALAPTNSLPPQPQPSPATNNPVTPVAAEEPLRPPFQLAEPPGVAPFPDRRPPASALSREVIFNPTGILLALLVMALSGYAGYEIARFKKRPVKLVCTLCAALPVVGPAVFLAMPGQGNADAAGSAGPLGAELPATTPPTPVPDLKYEDDPDSPYANLPMDATAETQFVEETAPAPAPAATRIATPAATTIEHYHSSEYEFTPAFFSQYFSHFVGEPGTGSEALILRTASGEFPVHYISSVDASGLRLIYAAHGQWVEQFIGYNELTEVEVMGYA